jgi:hypothetical protein
MKPWLYERAPLAAFRKVTIQAESWLRGDVLERRQHLSDLTDFPTPPAKTYLGRLVLTERRA